MNKKPVLVIADHHIHDFYHTLVIAEENIVVLQAKESSQFIKTNDADVVLIDCGSNTSKGFSLIKEIKTLRRNVPVIFLTDISSSDIEVKAYRTGARVFVEKPVNFFELRSTVENILRTKRTCREERVSFFADNNKKSDAPVNLVDSDIPENILRAVRYIEDNLSGVMNLDILSKRANLSKYYFSRLFKKYTGMSPLEFVKIFRIHTAKELLRKKNYTVSMVAEVTGFNDLSNFERNFKQVTGTTPKSYKKSMQKK
ncbi:MAG: response regulator transcription factor [Nitrospiraceae bacterium]|nr:MAG: response regulator transcription factor [Nitrospiraceae bacterium]